MSYGSDVAELRAEVEALRTLVANMVRVGPVEEIDAEKGYRLKLGQSADGEAYLSPWLPHPETGKTSVPLKKGQIVGLLAPTGDPQQGFMVRGGYSDEHSTPNADMEANVFEDAGVRVVIAGGKLTATVGDATLTISTAGLRIQVGDVDHLIGSGGVTTTGGLIKHDDKNIGSVHVHSGVAKGGANTNGPV
jgi:phage baseplate assembly protein gpV